MQCSRSSRFGQFTNSRLCSPPSLLPVPSELLWHLWLWNGSTDLLGNVRSHGLLIELCPSLTMCHLIYHDTSVCVCVFVYWTSAGKGSDRTTPPSPFRYDPFGQSLEVENDRQRSPAYQIECRIGLSYAKFMSPFVACA